MPLSYTARISCLQGIRRWQCHEPRHRALQDGSLLSPQCGSLDRLQRVCSRPRLGVDHLVPLQHADELFDFLRARLAFFTVWIRNRMAYWFALFSVEKTPLLSGVRRARAEGRPARR